jgi:tetratricopeptide (TPR) repeat protein
MSTPTGSFLRLRVSLVAFCAFVAFQQPNVRRRFEPVGCVERAQYLAWLNNWAGAAGVLDTLGHTNPGALQGSAAILARALDIRANVESASVPFAARDLGRLLDSDWARRDATLRILMLAMKGEVEFQYDLPAAERTWTELGQLASATGQAQWVGRASGELGCIAFLNGEPLTAIRRLGAAYFKAEAFADIAEEMKIFTALGEGLAEFGRPADAIHFFDKALKLSASNPDAYFPFTAYLGKARLLLRTERSEGRQMLLAGLERARRQNMRLREARILSVLGADSIRTGEIDAAVDWLTTATNVAHAAGLSRIEAEAASKLSSVLTSQGTLGEASAYARDSVAAAERAGDVYHLPQDLAALGEIEASRGNLRAAELTYARATRVVNSIFTDLPHTRHESTVVATMGSIFQGYFDLALNKLRDPSKAFAVLESARARGLADSIRERQAKELVDEQRDPAKLRTVADLNRRLEHEPVSADRTKLLERLWESELRSLRFRAGPGQDPSARHPHPVSLAELQGQLREGELMIEYVLGQGRSIAFALTRGAAVAYTLPSRKEIESAIDQQTQAIQQSRDGRAEGRLLYSMLFEPVGLLRSCNRIVLVPDGKIDMAAVGAALDPEGRYLVESHVLSLPRPPPRGTCSRHREGRSGRRWKRSA